jgi:mannose-6-phosphate isomerase-like protein (cupin superfamily)
MESINVSDKFNLINDLWNSKIITELNGQQVKISRIKGEFEWHDHKYEDKLFYILKGKMVMEFKTKKVEVNKGEMIVVPKGIEHRQIADEEVWMMLFKSQNIKHTGEVLTLI